MIICIKPNLFYFKAQYQDILSLKKRINNVKMFP